MARLQILGGGAPQKALLCVTADPRALFMQCFPTPTPFLLSQARMGETACLQGEGVGCQLSPAQVGEVGYEELEASSRSCSTVRPGGFHEVSWLVQ